MITAGILADNYKLERFKKELTEKGFKDFEIVANTKGTLAGTSTIKVQAKDVLQLKEIEKICKRVEMHYKRSN